MSGAVFLHKQHPQTWNMHEILSCGCRVRSKLSAELWRTVFFFIQHPNLNIIKTAHFMAMFSMGLHICIYHYHSQNRMYISAVAATYTFIICAWPMLWLLLTSQNFTCLLLRCEYCRPFSNPLVFSWSLSPSSGLKNTVQFPSVCLMYQWTPIFISLWPALMLWYLQPPFLKVIYFYNLWCMWCFPLRCRFRWNYDSQEQATNVWSDLK